MKNFIIDKFINIKTSFVNFWRVVTINTNRKLTIKWKHFTSTNNNHKFRINSNINTQSLTRIYSNRRSFYIIISWNYTNIAKMKEFINSRSADGKNLWLEKSKKKKSCFKFDSAHQTLNEINPSSLEISGFSFHQAVWEICSRRIKFCSALSMVEENVLVIISCSLFENEI